MADYGGTDNCMITERALLKLTDKVGDSYLNLALALRFSFDVAKNCGAPSLPVTVMPTEMLLKWRQMNAQLSQHELLEILIKTLKVAERTDLAEHINVYKSVEDNCNEIAPHLLCEWQKVAIHLGIPYHETETMKKMVEATLPTQTPAYTILFKWRQKEGTAATFDVLIGAFKKIRRFDLVKELLESPDYKGQLRTEDGPRQGPTFQPHSDTGPPTRSYPFTAPYPHPQEIYRQPTDASYRTAPDEHIRQGVQSLHIGADHPSFQQPHSFVTSQHQTPLQSQPDPRYRVDDAQHQSYAYQAAMDVDPTQGHNPSMSHAIASTGSTPGSTPEDFPATNMTGAQPAEPFMNNNTQGPVDDEGGAQEERVIQDEISARVAQVRIKLNQGYSWMDTTALQAEGSKARPVIVAVLDSGIDEEHQDLKGMVIGRHNFVAGEDDDLVRDGHCHGTMTAGILRQFAPNVKIMNLKVLRRNGNGSFLSSIKALEYINNFDQQYKDSKVDIIVMPFGLKLRSKKFETLLDEMIRNKVVITSASNEGHTSPDTMTFPASHGRVMAIGSCGTSGDRCLHSGVGKELSFLFPGEQVVTMKSRYADNSLPQHQVYMSSSGTSLAVPHAGALVALVLGLVEVKFGPKMRKAFTDTVVMTDLLKKTCRTTFTPEKGYGIPNVRDLTEEYIKHFINQYEKTGLKRYL